MFLDRLENIRAQCLSCTFQECERTFQVKIHIASKYEIIDRSKLPIYFVSFSINFEKPPSVTGEACYCALKRI